MYFSQRTFLVKCSLSTVIRSHYPGPGYPGDLRFSLFPFIFPLFSLVFEALVTLQSGWCWHETRPLYLICPFLWRNPDCNKHHYFLNQFDYLFGGPGDGFGAPGGGFFSRSSSSGLPLLLLSLKPPPGAPKPPPGPPKPTKTKQKTKRKLNKNTV